MSMITEQFILLSNDGALRARNNADSANVDMLKLTTGDKVQILTELDMGGNAISNVGNVDGRDVSADGAALDSHLDGGANKHDATEVDYERADGSKKNIQAASDDVEAALTDLDDAIGALASSPTNYTPSNAAITADHLVGIDTKLGQLDSTLSNFEWKNSAKDYVVDNTALPATEVSGDRYILSHDGGAPNAAWDGASAGDIVEFNGTIWVATTPTVGSFVAADDEPNGVYLWGGSSYSFKSFESTTASTGLTKSGFDIQLADAALASGIQVSSGAISIGLAAAGGLEFATGALQINLDGATLSLSASGIKVADGGIDTLQLAADSVDKTKIAADIAGLGLSQAVGGELDVNVDDSSIEINVDTLRVKAAGITNDMLAGSIADGKLASDYVQTSEVDDSTIEWSGTQLRVKDAGITEAKLNSGVDAQTFAATHTAVNYTPVAVGVEATTQISAHLKGIDNALVGANPTNNKESFTLAAGDITNQYVDLAQVARASSIHLNVVGGPTQNEGLDYTVNLTGGAGGNTRITFAGDLATGGSAALVAGNVLYVQYEY